MSIADNPNLAFYVKVEGQSFSSHRCPQGIYAVEVLPEKTLQHSACAASEVARDTVPFLSDHPDSFILRVFDAEGHEIRMGKSLRTSHASKGLNCGRTVNYPDVITLQ